MSTDARTNGSDDERPTGTEEGAGDPSEETTEVTSASVESGPSGPAAPQESEAGEVDSGEPPSAGPLDAAADAGPDPVPDVAEPAHEPEPVADPEGATVAPAPGADPALEETHVAAIPVQRHREGFDEIDGGDVAVPPVPDERGSSFAPTPDEDDALRDDALREERARRFGRPRPGEQVDPTAASEGEAAGTVPLAAAGAGAVATVGTEEAGSGTRTMPATTEQPTEPPATETAAPTGEDDPFKDFDDGPLSRAAAHWWSLLIAIVFVPVGWYLVADGGERLDFNLTNGGPLNLAAPLELAGGALCLFFVLLATRWSSVGAIVVGTVAALAGIAFIVFTDEALALVAEYQGVLVQGLKQLGQNIVDHLLTDLRSGRIAIYGFVLVMAGVISHGARRQGRREERRRAAYGA